MNLDLLYAYLFDMGWFFLITVAVMVSTAAVILFLEAFETASLPASGENDQH